MLIELSCAACGFQLNPVAPHYWSSTAPLPFLPLRAYIPTLQYLLSVDPVQSLHHQFIVAFVHLTFPLFSVRYIMTYPLPVRLDFS